MVTKLEKMMQERLALYKARAGHLPERILVYRDGVSEVLSLLSGMYLLLILFAPRASFPLLWRRNYPPSKLRSRNMIRERVLISPS